MNPKYISRCAFRVLKTLPTFTNVFPDWSPLNAVHSAPCNVCCQKNQRRTMVLERWGDRVCVENKSSNWRPLDLSGAIASNQSTVLVASNHRKWLNCTCWSTWGIFDYCVNKETLVWLFQSRCYWPLPRMNLIPTLINKLHGSLRGGDWDHCSVF